MEKETSQNNGSSSSNNSSSRLDLKNVTKLNLSDKIVDFIFKNRILLGAILLVTTLGFSGFYAYKAFESKKESQAMDVFALGEKIYLENESQMAQATPSKIDLEQALPHFQKVLADFPGTKTSYISALRVVDIYSKKNQIKESHDLLAPIVQKADFSNLIAALMALRFTSLQEQLNFCDQAIPVLEKIEQKQSSLKAEAYLRLGLCYSKMNNSEKSKEYFQKLTKDFSDTPQGQQAQKYLKLSNS